MGPEELGPRNEGRYCRGLRPVPPIRVRCSDSCLMSVLGPSRRLLGDSFSGAARMGESIRKCWRCRWFCCGGALVRFLVHRWRASVPENKSGAVVVISSTREIFWRSGSAALALIFWRSGGELEYQKNLLAERLFLPPLTRHSQSECRVKVFWSSGGENVCQKNMYA